MQDAIQRPFESGDLHARKRLIALLRHLTIRASKEDLTMLVGCSRKACPPLTDFEVQGGLQQPSQACVLCRSPCWTLRPPTPGATMSLLRWSRTTSCWETGAVSACQCAGTVRMSALLPPLEALGDRALADAGATRITARACWPPVAPNLHVRCSPTYGEQPTRVHAPVYHSAQAKRQL